LKRSFADQEKLTGAFLQRSTFACVTPKFSAQPRFESLWVVFAKIKAKIPGTKMAFAGIKNETEAQNLWAYISSFDKDGKQKQ
jgi:hypothetical protein